MGVLPIAQAGEGFHRVIGQERAHVFQEDPLTGLNCFTQHYVRRSGFGQLHQVELRNGVIGDAVVAVPIALGTEALPLSVCQSEAGLHLQRLPGCVRTLYASGHEITGDGPLTGRPTVGVSALEEQKRARCVPYPNAGG